MEILSYIITKPVILLFEILFMIFGRIFGTDVAVMLAIIIANILFIPIYYAADYSLNKSFLPAKKTKDYILSISYPVIFFFIHFALFSATFSFFKEVDVIHGTVLGPISDLALPDGLIKTASSTINLLPLIFFVLSGISIFVGKKNKLSNKMFSIVLFVILSVLLYFSSAGSNLFWITYALIRLLMKLLLPLLARSSIRTDKNPLSAQSINSKNVSDIKSEGDPIPTSNNDHKKKKERKPDIFLFLSGVAYLIILTGIFIPTNIMKVSAAEFVDVLDVRNPLHYIFYSFAYAFGTFGIWLGIFYFLTSSKIKVLLDRVVWIVSVISFINLILAGSYLGEISPGLFYFEYHEFDFGRTLIDIILSVAVGILVFILIEKKKEFMRILVAVELGMVIFSSVTNSVKINSVYQKLDYMKTEKETDDIISLDKNGKNVVVLIMDRALSTEVPYIFNEKPELKEQFDGFTYYPNTISFGGFTNTGIPAVYGGYEYTPDKINERNTESLEEKHNEALKVLPVLFNQNEYNVTVCDPAYAGYNWIPDLSIYDDYPAIEAFNTEGKFDNSAPADYIGPRELLKRNFFVHSLMKIAPFNWQFLLYNDGHYCNPNMYISQSNSIYQSEGYDCDFLDTYLVLSNLTNITSVSSKNNNHFLLFYNGTPHMPCLLQEADYIPQRVVDNREYHQNDSERYVVDGEKLSMQNSTQLKSYCVNMATYIQLGKWFDYLRENGCYDNSRIIIVSDHGRDVHVLDKIGDSDVVVEYFMPVLMVKDFNATGFNTSEEIMTNADVASLATDGIIDNPTNPFSGNPLDGHEKNTDGMTVFYSDKCNLEDNHGNVFVPGKWFEVHDNPHDLNNWSYLGEK